MGLADRLRELADEAEAMEARLMPEGMEWLLEVWPRWSNGEYCRFGDWWTADRYGDYEPRQLRRLVIYAPELLDEWEQGDGESYGYEWDFMRPSELDYRPDKVEPPAPAVLAADGEPLEVGQTVWRDDGEMLEVLYLRPDGLVDCCGEIERPERLTHERPDSWERLEEDGSSPSARRPHRQAGTGRTTASRSSAASGGAR